MQAHDHPRFELYWTTLHIGTLFETNRDMRSSGRIIYHFNYEDPQTEHARLAESIRNSIEASAYLDESDMENYNRMCERESAYMDIIEGGEWYVVDEEGVKIKILCPIFHPGDEVTWQVV